MTILGIILGVLGKIFSSVLVAFGKYDHVTEENLVDIKPFDEEYEALWNDVFDDARIAGLRSIPASEGK